MKRLSAERQNLEAKKKTLKQGVGFGTEITEGTD
jgi:hypothetical protein